MIYVVVYRVSFENILKYHSKDQWEASHDHRQEWDKPHEVHILCE